MTLNIPGNTPVIVGVADIIDRRKEDGPDPLSFLVNASELSFQDTGISNLHSYIDAVGVVRFSVDFLQRPTNQILDIVIFLGR